MGESWLYKKLGHDAVSGKRSALVIFNDASSLKEAYSEEFLSRLNLNTIYLTFNMPTEKISKPMSHGDILWLDGSNEQLPPTPGYIVTQIKFRKNLVAMSALLSTIFSGGNRSFFIMNSLDELVAANGSAKSSQFVKFLALRMRSASIGCIFFITKVKENEKLISSIAPLFDEIYHL